MLQTRDAKRTAAAAVKIAVDMVDEGDDHARRRRSAGSSRPRSTSSCAPPSTRPRSRARSRSSTASTPRPARPSAGPSSTPTPPSSGSSAARRSSSSGSRPRPTTSTAWPSPRGSSPPAAARPRTRRSSPARSASRASPARRTSIVDYAGKQAHCTITGTDFEEGDWVSLDGSTGDAVPRARSRPCPGPVRGPARAPADPRLGRRDPPDGRLDQRRQARGGRPGPQLRRRRASACAAPSTCSARATASRSCAARSSSRTSRPGPRPSVAAGDALTADEQEAVATFDAAMAKLEVLQQGDFEGIFKAMDGLPVVIRLIDPPLHEFLPEPRGAARQGHPGRGARRRLRGGQAAARDDQVAARAEPDARPARLPPRA